MVYSLHIVFQEAGLFENIIINLQKWKNIRILKSIITKATRD